MPGATTLATLFLIADKLPPTWHKFFVEGEQNWKAVVVPLVLGGLCYAIGVLFEVIDYSSPMKPFVMAADAMASRRAWVTSGENEKQLEGWSKDQLRLFRFDIWGTLVFEEGHKPNMGIVFSHCHRFQAEYKMLLHLVYPGLLFAALSIWSHRSFWWVAVDLTVVVILFYLSYLRDERRWLQALNFSKRLEKLDKAIKALGPQQAAHATKASHS